MRPIRLLAVSLAIVFGSCSQPSAGAHSTATPSPTPVSIGTATLSASNCNFDFPTRLPMGSVTWKLVNNTSFTGRFILGRIDDGHVYQEFADYLKAGTPGKPPFITEYGFVDVQSNGTGSMAANLREGTYIFHCGYADKTGKVTEFWRGPLEAART